MRKVWIRCEADANNPLFQHEYGHVLQSRASGLAYLTRYAIPSIKSASSGEGEHYNSPSEQDASDGSEPSMTF